MDLWTLILSPEVREVSSTAILVGVVVSIFTGILVPGRTHKREMAAAQKVADEHRFASERKDKVIELAMAQNGQLLAGVRIADKYYADFLPPIDEFTKPRAEVRNVVE